MREIWIGAIGSIVGAILLIVGQRIYFGWKSSPGLLKMLRFTREFTTYGGLNFFSSRKSYSRCKDLGDQSEYIGKAKNSIVYVGFWLAHGTTNGDIVNGIRKQLENNKKVIIVLLDPESPVVEYCSHFLGGKTSDVKQRIHSALSTFKGLHEGLSSDAKKRLTIKLHNISLNASAFLLDHEHDKGRILVDIKLYGLSRDESVGIEVGHQGRLLFDKFTKSYIKIVENAKDYPL